MSLALRSYGQSPIHAEGREPPESRHHAMEKSTGEPKPCLVEPGDTCESWIRASGKRVWKSPGHEEEMDTDNAPNSHNAARGRTPGFVKLGHGVGGMSS